MQGAAGVEVERCSYMCEPGLLAHTEDLDIRKAATTIDTVCVVVKTSQRQ